MYIFKRELSESQVADSETSTQTPSESPEVAHRPASGPGSGVPLPSQWRRRLSSLDRAAAAAHGWPVLGGATAPSTQSPSQLPAGRRRVHGHTNPAARLGKPGAGPAGYGVSESRLFIAAAARPCRGVRRRRGSRAPPTGTAASESSSNSESCRPSLPPPSRCQLEPRPTRPAAAAVAADAPAAAPAAAPASTPAPAGFRPQTAAERLRALPACLPEPPAGG